MELDDDLEAASNLKQQQEPSAYDPPTRSGADRDASPLPAPVPQKPMSSMPRESLDGDTIFAVGEDGGDSDLDATDDESERRGMMGHKRD